MARARQKELARLCQRLSTGLSAGVEIRRLFETEARNQYGAMQSRLVQIRDQINEGETLHRAFLSCGSYFPTFMLDLIAVGEHSGKLPATFRRLAEHYEHLLRVRREFLTGIRWPAIELGFGIIIVGLYILILGWVAGTAPGPKITVFGLIGFKGLMIYIGIISTTAIVIWCAVLSVLQGWWKTTTIMKWIMKIPGIGGFIQALSLSKMTWCLSLATEAGLDIKRTVELSIRSTQNPYYIGGIPTALDVISDGGELAAAFIATRAYPVEFVDAIEAGELSGKLEESLEALSRSYDEQTKLFLKSLTVAGGVLVFLLVAFLIGSVIFSMVKQYTDTLYELM